jgi:hypothetical protein
MALALYQRALGSCGRVRKDQPGAKILFVHDCGQGSVQFIHESSFLGRCSSFLARSGGAISSTGCMVP